MALRIRVTSLMKMKITVAIRNPKEENPKSEGRTVGLLFGFRISDFGFSSCGRASRPGTHTPACRLRVRAAFLAEAERAAADRDADALPPILPPLCAEACVSGTPRPLPDLLPPPVSLLT